ncbi:glycosyltransferase [Pseudarthrobacter sp. PvP090]|uniref:glycosyltransferase n=1 Tax=Pseudarthrobacter sp. PvP090 TaxID=3156393 RepID=UPI00339930C8
MTAPSRVLMAHPGAELYGADRVFLESVAAVANHGATVTVVLPQTGPLVAELERLQVTVRFCPTPVLRKSTLRPRALLGLAGLTLKAFNKGQRLVADVRPDLVYVSTLTIPLWGFLGRLAGKPVLTHVHEAEESAPPFLLRVLAAPLVLSSTIVSNSHFSARVLARSLPLLSGRTQVLYNGIPGPESVEVARDAIQGALRLLYVGRLSRRKGVDVAVEAVARARQEGVNVSLDIVGDVFPGYEEFEGDLRQRVRRLKLEDVVTFHGFKDDVWPLRNTTDVAIVPSSFDEPFGNTAVEAILSARPLIVSDTSGLREAAAGYESAQFVPPGDVDAFARAIATVSARWNHYRMTAVGDAQQAAHRHSLHKYANDLNQQVDALVAGAAQRRSHVLS